MIIAMQKYEKSRKCISCQIENPQKLTRDTETAEMSDK
jgi:hypothetical protein